MMRIVGLVAVLGFAASCSISHGESAKQPGSAGAPDATSAASAVAERTVEEELRADEIAYRFLYLPEQSRLTTDHRGEWVAIVAGRVATATGARIEPVKTLEDADAAARAAAPNATHRFVFQVGEEGDVEWPMGGCELQHVLGNPFLALLKRPDVKMEGLGPGERIEFCLGDTLTEITVKGADDRMYLRPEVGAPAAAGAASETYCISTGFNGAATMSPASAAGLELWEIPGVAHVKGEVQSGDCRRARARMRWANTPLDFVVPVAVWPK